MTVEDPKELVRRGYDSLGDRYRADDVADGSYAPWLAALRARTPPGDAVLDLGCGCGIPVARSLAQAGYRVTGVDVSWVQLRRARRLVPTARFLHADATRVAFPAEAFDAVVCLYVLVHLTAPGAAGPAAAHRRLAAARRLAAGQRGRPGPLDRHRGWLAGRPAPMWWSHADAVTYRAWIQAAGLRVTEQEVIPEERGSSVVKRRSRPSPGGTHERYGRVMDDADGGLRGLRARPAPGLFQALWDHWGLGPFVEGVDLGGSSSLNLLVDDGDRRYVVRVHRPHVTPERLVAVHRARRALLEGGVPCAPAVPTVRGEPRVCHQGRLIEVEAFVAHDAVMDSWERLEVGMGLLAQTHGLLRDVEVGEQGRRPWFANHLEPADVEPATRRGAARIRSWGPSGAEASLAAAAEELAALVTGAEAGLVSQVPRQLVHGDFWDNNVLFRRGELVLLADFDFMGERARVDDLALTLWCASADLGTGAGTAEVLTRLRRLLVRYDASADLPLSAAERAALPLAMARQPLSSIGGWVSRLDDEAAARRHAATVAPELQAALRMMIDLGRWQDAFA